MNKQIKKQRFALTLLFSLVVFCITAITIVIAGGSVYILASAGILAITKESLPEAFHIIMFTSIISIIAGFIIALSVSRIPLRPVNKLIEKMNQLASGNFKVRLHFGWPITRHPTFQELSCSFNTMAEELENTEMLRSDFINNFSHEFKTPIVSIAGFAKLLKRGNIPEGQQQEYLNAIEEESLRLSQMATNVLNLTKVENQMILTDTTAFNLSEQIRSCILLVENKWVKKNIDMEITFGEHMITANEELLKQVWINLIDNAVKFSPVCGSVIFIISESSDYISVSITNSGSEIPPEKHDKIFNKFYQADESHSSEGNGIGLAIVKKVISLHNGEIKLYSEKSSTTFTVILPKILISI